MLTTPTSTDGADGPTTKSRGRELLLKWKELSPEDHAYKRLRDEVIESYMPLVAYFAKRFAGRGVPLADLTQVGAIGLIKAVDRFDPAIGVEFASFAAPNVMGEIKRHFRDTGWIVHVPRQAKELQSTVKRTRTELSQQWGRSPTVAEIAAQINIEPDRVLEALDVARAYNAVPFESLLSPGETTPDHPALTITDGEFGRVEQRAVLREALSELPEAERRVLVLRFFTGRTQTDIAKIVGTSQMQVSRLLT
ncbi:MAG: SigB/SigF/SigG family RNA polymerase sigma factor, partial [Nakamurella sp.]